MNDSNHWQLKINPNAFDFQAWSQEGNNRFFYWSPIQATEDYHGNYIGLHSKYSWIKSGDKIVLTLHHDEYGVIGTGEVVSNYFSEEMVEYERYYIVDTKHSFRIPVIKILVKTLFIDDPITWRYLKKNKLVNRVIIKKAGVLYSASEYRPRKIDKDGWIPFKALWKDVWESIDLINI
jgi:hypothetical protein